MKETKHIITSDGNFCTISTDAELYHYGVKGMKWGVRRYRNYDGSYTKKGLDRFRKAESDYDAAKNNSDTVKRAYKSGTATKQQFKAAKSELKNAKRKMSDSYDKLKSDNLADQGRKLYARGKTIEENNRNNKYAQIGILGSRIVAKTILRNNFGGTKVGDIGSTVVGLGTFAASALMTNKTHSENKKLRAYYAHRG